MVDNQTLIVLAKNCEMRDVHMVVGYRIMTHFYTKFDYCFSARNQFKIIRNRLRLGLRPRPRWGSLRRSPRPPNRICSGASLPRLARFARSLLGRFAPSAPALRTLVNQALGLICPPVIIGLFFCPPPVQVWEALP